MPELDKLSSSSFQHYIRRLICPITIAVAGKGGTGKTTVVKALIIDHLARLGVGAILAVDADPSTNLNLALGVDLEDTVGGERRGPAGRYPDGTL